MSNQVKAISTNGQFAKEEVFQVAPNCEFVWNTLSTSFHLYKKWKKEEEILFETKQHFKNNAPSLFFYFCLKVVATYSY